MRNPVSILTDTTLMMYYLKAALGGAASAVQGMDAWKNPLFVTKRIAHETQLEATTEILMGSVAGPNSPFEFGDMGNMTAATASGRPWAGLRYMRGDASRLLKNHNRTIDSSAGWWPQI